MMADRLVVPQPAPVTPALRPLLERVSGTPGGLQGAPRPSTRGLDQRSPAGVLPELATLAGVGACKFAAAEAALGTQTGPVLGWLTSTPMRSKSGWDTYALRFWGARLYSCSLIGHAVCWERY